jgi:competence ComEA-like helix-hairpin-helix protein
MPLYASYKPANRAASERGWFPSSPQSATPPHEDEGADESESESKSEGKSDANKEPEHRLETAPTSALSGASSPTRGKGAGASEGGEVLAARGEGDARPSPQEQAQEVDTRIDLNRATQAELETLPGVGPATAKKIIAYRERRAFTRTSQLQNVRGIGQKTYRKLAPLVKVEAAN